MTDKVLSSSYQTNGEDMCDIFEAKGYLRLTRKTVTPVKRELREKHAHAVVREKRP